jgi:hypothetical protein
VLAQRVAEAKVDVKVAERIERRRHRERVSELICALRQILQYREIVARARFNRTRDRARLLHRGDLDVHVHAVRDVRRLTLPGVERGVGRAAELGVGRQHGRAERVAEEVVMNLRVREFSPFSTGAAATLQKA